MNNSPAHKFSLPYGLSLPAQVNHLKQVIIKYRKEILPLRNNIFKLNTNKKRLEDEILEWKEKYQKVKQERDQFKEENGRLKQEKDKLEKEIERLTKTNSRYQVSLFDHGNFKHPDNGDEEVKPKGGQLNHPDTNREGQANFPGYDSFPRKRIYAKSCGKCGQDLSRVDSFKEKVLLDIVIKPEIIQMILESERQWCGKCKMEVNTKDPQSLPFTEYGLNTFMMVMILRFRAHCSFASTSKVIEISFGMHITKSDISNMLKVAAKYLGKKYEELKQAVRDGDVIYMDETGWLVKGQKAWMWIMANEETIVYVAAESRGKGIAEDIYGDSCSLCMTDGLGSYTNSIPKEKHCFCWAHLLRFAFEETIHSRKNSQAVYLRDELVGIYHLKQNHPEYSKETLKQVLNLAFNRLLNLSSDEVSFKNIQNRLREQREGLIKSLLETTSGTNNLSERELRNLVLLRHVSYGSDTYQGMETTAILASLIQTLTRQKQNLLPNLKDCLQLSIQEKYSQYTHTPYFDTS